MNQDLPQFEWLDSQQIAMVTMLEEWVSINSSSDNLAGLSNMAAAIKKAFAPLGNLEEVGLSPRILINDAGTEVEVPVGNALLLTRRPKAPVQVFLGGHMDTVFPVTSPFQKAQRLAGNRLQGPGAADMKGGLLVMLKALETFEKSPCAENLGWRVLISPDEELGSPSSASLIIKAAKGADYGLIFEPAFPDGTLASQRKGSANYTLTVRGKAAHVGRDFASGVSAISALFRILSDIEAIQTLSSDITVNVGKILGGGPVNIVPDFAMARFNIRMSSSEDFNLVNETLDQIIETRQGDDINIHLHQDCMRYPKPFDKRTEEIFTLLKDSARSLGISLSWKATGGVCDGNILAREGIPTIDTLGVVGGGLHTEQEYVHLPSLIERARLSALLLMKLAKAKDSS